MNNNMLEFLNNIHLWHVRSIEMSVFFICRSSLSS